MSQQEASNGVIERIAECMHELWAGWTEWMFDKWDEMHSSGESFQARWRRQIATPYANLSEQEKESDRDVARQLLKMLEGKSLFVVCTPDLLWQLTTERDSRQRTEAEAARFIRVLRGLRDEMRLVELAAAFDEAPLPMGAVAAFDEVFPEVLDAVTSVAWEDSDA